MPAELKHKILGFTPDVQTLSALVHASPDFHAVYLTNRKQIYSRILNQQLLDLGIDLRKPTALLEVSFPHNTRGENFRKSSALVALALEKLGGKIRSDEELRLHWKQCVELGFLASSQKFIVWNLDLEDIWSDHFTPSYREKPPDYDSYWKINGEYLEFAWGIPDNEEHRICEQMFDAFDTAFKECLLRRAKRLAEL